jgi:hypothetical protein
MLETRNSTEILATAARAVTQAFLSGSEEVRDAIEMGFLEPALETEGLRRYFENWSTDRRLCTAWERHWSGEKLIRTSQGASAADSET